MSAELGLADAVTLHRARQRCRRWRRPTTSADVLVVTSAHEGFCVPVVEAMAAGLPVVAVDQGSLPEVLGDAGVLVSLTRSRTHSPTPSARLLAEAPRRDGRDGCGPTAAGPSSIWRAPPSASSACSAPSGTRSRREVARGVGDERDPSVRSHAAPGRRGRPAHVARCGTCLSPGAWSRGSTSSSSTPRPRPRRSRFSEYARGRAKGRRPRVPVRDGVGPRALAGATARDARRQLAQCHAARVLRGLGQPSWPGTSWRHQIRIATAGASRRPGPGGLRLQRIGAAGGGLRSHGRRAAGSHDAGRRCRRRQRPVARAARPDPVPAGSWSAAWRPTRA